MTVVKNIVRGVLLPIQHSVLAQLGAKLNYNTDEVDTYIEGLSTPLSSGQVDNLRLFVWDIKRGSKIKTLAEKYDDILLLAGETSESSLRNLVKRATDATLVNAPAFTAFQGFTGNASNALINTNYIPATHGINFSLNDASVGINIMNDTVGGYYDFGGTDASYVNGTRLGVSYSGTSYFTINSDGTGSVSNENSSGFYVLNRISSETNNLSLFKDSINIKNVTNDSSGLSSYPIFILAINRANTPLFHSNRKVSFFFAGKSLDENDRKVLRDAYDAYMDRVFFWLGMMQMIGTILKRGLA